VIGKHGAPPRRRALAVPGLREGTYRPSYHSPPVFDAPNERIRALCDLTEPLSKADDGSRTRYLELGKLALYQVSYVRS
jgi:hypothetical protein